MNAVEARATTPDRPDARVGAIVLAGGRASRLGQSKPLAVVGGEPLLAHTLNAVAGLRTVVVGPAELGKVVDGWAAASLTRESPAFGGPVAGIAAGLAAIDAGEHVPDWLIVLACDLPRAAEIVDMLLAVVTSLGDAESGACLEADGHPQWLCGVYRTRALRDSIEGLRASGSLDSAAARALLGPLSPRRIADSDALSLDIDTPADLLAANERAQDRRT